MLNKKTIIVEDRLEETFAYLPIQVNNNVDYKPVFKVGSKEDLIAFFLNSKGLTKYPLLWLQTPYEEKHTSRNKVEVDLELILAVESTVELLNSERMDKTFKPFLYPLLDNILDIFQIGNTISQVDKDFKITKYANHSDVDKPEEGAFVDVWDAIQLTIKVTINDSCLRTIKL